MTQLTSTGNNSQPVWQPGGAKIAFMSGRSGTSEPYTMNPDGSSVAQLNSTGLAVSSWSPLADRIATGVYDPVLAVYEVATMNPDGSGLTQITTDAAADYGAYWSPGGSTGSLSKILFVSPLGTNPTNGPIQNIFVVNSDGTGEAQLTFPPPGTYGVGSISPAWSPDATKIAFLSSMGGPFDLWVMNADGTGQTQVTFGGATGGVQDLISWTQDGKRIVYGSSRPNGAGTEQLWIINADGSGNTQLTSGNDYAPSCRSCGRFDRL